MTNRLGRYAGSEVTFGICPEDLHIASDADPAELTLDAVVEVVERLGPEILLDIAVGRVTMVASVEPTATSKVHERLRLGVNPHRMHFFDNETENATDPGSGFPVQPDERRVIRTRKTGGKPRDLCGATPLSTIPLQLQTKWGETPCMIDRRRFVQLSGGLAATAGSGGLAAILAAGRAPAYAQGTTVHWLRWADFVPASDQLLKGQIATSARRISASSCRSRRSTPMTSRRASPPRSSPAPAPTSSCR